MQTRRMGDHGPRPFVLTPSRFQWHKFKDSLHYAVMIGLIPMGALLFYVNVFIGPATLQKIPDGYEPKHWEFHSVSIQRWISFKKNRHNCLQMHFCFSIRSVVSWRVTCIHRPSRNMKRCCMCCRRRPNAWPCARSSRKFAPKWLNARIISRTTIDRRWPNMCAFRRRPPTIWKNCAETTKMCAKSTRAVIVKNIM